VSKVTDMEWMFRSTPFNQDIGSWNVSKVTTMRAMFSSATGFDQDLSNRNVESLTNGTQLFEDA